MILKYPYPYKAWFTIANDPDNTLIADWQELDAFIWKELELPLGNSLFVKSMNRNLPMQVNLMDNPEINSQYHDIIHTWGDYMHSRTRGFDREDAVEAIAILQQHGIQPKVWIDHAQFGGNFLHSSQNGAISEFKDRSGHVYKQYMYTLDLAEQLGIRYIWDGEVTSVIGQDRRLSSIHYFINTSKSVVKAIPKIMLYAFSKVIKYPTSPKYNVPANEQYFVHRFPDGRKFYCFRRYGSWRDADIYGLYNIIRPEKIDDLLKTGGTVVVYTHLGKRPYDKMEEAFHIPENTKSALINLKNKFQNQELMISPLSELLDYLVIRDHIEYLPSENSIRFIPDKIRYVTLSQKDLSGKSFSFECGQMKTLAPSVMAGDVPLDYELRWETQDIFTIIIH